MNPGSNGIGRREPVPNSTKYTQPQQQQHNPASVVEACLTDRSTSPPASVETFMHSGRVEDHLRTSHLADLMGFFQQEQYRALGLDMTAFCRAMRRYVHDANISQEQLALLFMKIDTSCDGNVDWDEFCTYMLLDYEEKATSSPTAAFDRLKPGTDIIANEKSCPMKKGPPLLKGPMVDILYQHPHVIHAYQPPPPQPLVDSSLVQSAPTTTPPPMTSPSPESLQVSRAAIDLTAKQHAADLKGPAHNAAPSLVVSSSAADVANSMDRGSIAKRHNKEPGSTDKKTTSVNSSSTSNSCNSCYSEDALPCSQPHLRTLKRAVPKRHWQHQQQHQHQYQHRQAAQQLASVHADPGQASSSLHRYCGIPRYFCITEGGGVHIFRPDLVAVKTAQIALAQVHIRVTACSLIAGADKVAVALTNRTVRIYDVSSSALFDAYTVLEGFEHSILALATFSDADTDVLYMGDMVGTVHKLFVFDRDFSLLEGRPGDHPRRHQARMGKEEHVHQTSVASLPRDVFVSEPIHSDWVESIIGFSCPGSFISCSGASADALAISESSSLRKFRIPKGIRAIDHCRHANIIACGGGDCNVHLFNTHTTGKQLALLQGHKTAIEYLAIHCPLCISKLTSASPSCGVLQTIITVSTTHVIKMWSVQLQACILTVPAGYAHPTHYPLDTMLFNKVNGSIVLAAERIRSIQLSKSIGTAGQAQQSHTDPLTSVCYNALFNQVVTSCRGSVVAVWNLTTGEKLLQFSPAHSNAQITTSTFDRSQRRLLSAASDGSVKLWNFNVGVPLMRLQCHEKSEIHAILQLSDGRILTAGWDKVVSVFSSCDGSEYYVHPDRAGCAREHVGDINSLVELSPLRVASSSSDGVIITWKVFDKLSKYKVFNLPAFAPDCVLSGMKAWLAPRATQTHSTGWLPTSNQQKTDTYRHQVQTNFVLAWGHAERGHACQGMVWLINLQVGEVSASLCVGAHSLTDVVTVSSPCSEPHSEEAAFRGSKTYGYTRHEGGTPSKDPKGVRGTSSDASLHPTRLASMPLSSPSPLSSPPSPRASKSATLNRVHAVASDVSGCISVLNLSPWAHASQTTTMRRNARAKACAGRTPSADLRAQVLTSWKAHPTSIARLAIASQPYPVRARHTKSGTSSAGKPHFGNQHPQAAHTPNALDKRAHVAVEREGELAPHSYTDSKNSIARSHQQDGEEAPPVAINTSSASEPRVHFLLTAGDDASCRAWLLNGTFVGLFGQDTQWNIFDSTTYTVVPDDIAEAYYNGSSNRSNDLQPERGREREHRASTSCSETANATVGDGVSCHNTPPPPPRTSSSCCDESRSDLSPLRTNDKIVQRSLANATKEDDSTATMSSKSEPRKTDFPCHRPALLPHIPEPRSPSPKRVSSHLQSTSNFLPSVLGSNVCSHITLNQRRHRSVVTHSAAVRCGLASTDVGDAGPAPMSLLFAAIMRSCAPEFPDFKLPPALNPRRNKPAARRKRRGQPVQRALNRSPVRLRLAQPVAQCSQTRKKKTRSGYGSLGAEEN